MPEPATQPSKPVAARLPSASELRSASEQEDADIAAIVPTTLVRSAGAVSVAAGVFMLLLGAQTYSIVSRWTVLLALLTVMMCTLGAATLYLGTRVMRFRGWASVAGSASAGASLLLAGVWFVYALLSGVLSLLALCLMPLTLLSLLLSSFSIPTARKADAARARLSEVGLEAGD